MRTSLAIAFCLAPLSNVLATEPRSETTIAVVDVHTTVLDAKYAPILTDVLTTEVAARGFEVVSSNDIAAMIGFEQQKQLLGCDDNECLAEIGGALGVDLLLVPRVGKLGAQYVLSINLVDIHEARSVDRVYENVAGDVDVLISTIKTSVDKLFTGGTHAGGASTFDKPLPLALWIAGGVGLLTGAGFGIAAKVQEGHANNSAYEGGQLQIDSARRSQLIANIGYGVGAATAVAGTVLWILGRRSDEIPSVSVTPMARGAIAVVSTPIP